MSLIAEAYDLFDAGELEEASKACKEVLSREPDNFHALLLLGSIEADRGSTASAKRRLKRALEI
jgi:predicted Zn-dependent protease